MLSCLIILLEEAYEKRKNTENSHKDGARTERLAIQQKIKGYAINNTWREKREALITLYELVNKLAKNDKKKISTPEIRKK